MHEATFAVWVTVAESTPEEAAKRAVQAEAWLREGGYNATAGEDVIIVDMETYDEVYNGDF